MVLDLFEVVFRIPKRASSISMARMEFSKLNKTKQFFCSARLQRNFKFREFASQISFAYIWHVCVNLRLRPYDMAYRKMKFDSGVDRVLQLYELV